MSFEVPYLINPAKRIKVRSNKKKTGLPSALLKRMIREYGPGPEAFRAAWEEFREGKRNYPKLPPSYHRKTARHRPVVYSGVKKGVYVRSPYSHSPKINPLGGSVLIVGANEKAKGGEYRMKRKYNDPDPGPRRKKSHRRNPAAQSTEMSIHQPMSFVMPAAMTAAGYFGANYIPTLLGSVVGTSALTRIGVKAALGVVSPMFLKGRNGMFLAAGILANTVLDAVNTFLFPTTTTSTGFDAIVSKRTIGPSRRVTPPLNYPLHSVTNPGVPGLQGFGVPAGYAISPYTVAVPSFPS